MIKGSQDVSSTYDLFGVVYHMGDLGSGHYTARAVDRTHRNGDRNGYGNGASKWFNYNDSVVSETDERDVMARSKNAYMLFFQRRGAPAR